MFHSTQNTKGQSAVELAVFGSILIFVIGIIVRQSLGVNYQQHQSFKALRTAMTLSYKYSEGLAPPIFEVECMNQVIKGDSDICMGGRDGTASRNTASVVMIEDRLVAESGKYAAVDRSPQISFGSASHSRNVSMPVDGGEHWNLPIYDIFINGQQFPFTTADFIVFFKNTPIWDFSYFALPVFYKIVVNQRENEEWCNGFAFLENVQPFGRPCPGGRREADERFDLDRDGTTDVPRYPEDERINFSWQWSPVNPDQIDVVEGNNTVLDLDGDLKEERFLGGEGGPTGVLDFQMGDIDFTYDKNDERDFKQNKPCKRLGRQFICPKPRPGLLDDLQMFTFVKSSKNSSERGTYLSIEEGKLFQNIPGKEEKQFIRNVQKQDQVDVIQRAIQLSNNTGRFCHRLTNRPTRPGALIGGLPTGIWRDLPNPVEVCCRNGTCHDRLKEYVAPSCGLSTTSNPPPEECNCYSPLMASRTCMEVGQKRPEVDESVYDTEEKDVPEDEVEDEKRRALRERERYEFEGRFPPKIFVRSRPYRRGGHKWATDVSEDEYLDVKWKEDEQN